MIDDREKSRQVAEELVAAHRTDDPAYSEALRLATGRQPDDAADVEEQLAEAHHAVDRVVDHLVQIVVAAITRLAAAFPQTFGLEKHLAHRPLKIGIPADLRAALPELPSRVGQGTGRLCETHHVPAGAHGRRAARRSCRRSVR